MYQPPVKKPAIATVFGILNLVFAAMGVFGLLGSLMFLFGPAMDQNNPVMKVMNESDGYRVFLLVTSAFGVIFAVVLAFAGIGLLQVKPFGRTLSIVYGIYGILMGIGGTIGNYVFLVQPLMEQAGDGPAAAGAIGGAIGGMVGGCVGMIYPIVLLFFMFKRSFIEQMREYNAPSQLIEL